MLETRVGEDLDVLPPRLFTKVVTGPKASAAANTVREWSAVANSRSVETR
jgi:hypothetical protein